MLFLEAEPATSVGDFVNIDSLVFGTSFFFRINSILLILIRNLNTDGLRSKPNFTEKRLAPGENKTKIAFYSFSRFVHFTYIKTSPLTDLNSGTTGKPKAVAIPHHSILANVLQKAAYNRLMDPTLTSKTARYRRGDVAMAVLPMFRT